ncbi:MAG: PD-(D/E)XK nuclease family protein [Solirubrobacterales bacterium]
MSIELIVGPPNSGRAEAILARFRTALERDPVLVVPTADDVAGFERQLCEGGGATNQAPQQRRGSAPPRSASLGGSIATFEGLTAQVVRALSPALPPELTVSQRQALVRAAIDRVQPRRLRRSAARPGFAPALDALIAELQAALVAPGEFANLVAELDDPGYESELAELYGAYAELRDAGGRADHGTTLERAIAALRADPDGWGARPVFLYGFDDLARAQLELVDALSAAGAVTVAVTFADRRALAVRAGLISVLREELGASTAAELPFDEDYTDSRTLRHLDRNLFEPGAGRVEPDDGLVLMQSAGERGEAEAIGIEIARLLRSGYAPDELAVVLRHPAGSGPLLAAVLRDLGVPVALEAPAPLSATCVGGSLIALCRAALDEGAVDQLLRHLRLDPSLDPGLADSVERRVRRGDAQTVSAATDRWKSPPVHLTRLREAGDAAGRLRALARSARELAEGAHRRQAPLARERAEAGGVPFSALELRAGVAAAELLSELASVGELPGCEQPDLEAAIEALEAASVALWRGPATGRVRIMSPYRARAARARALFCASLQDGEFPSAAPPDPLLSEDRRREIGNRDLRRSDPVEEERYLFHSCVSRPTERLYLSWQGTDEDGTALARSPFVDEVIDLVAPVGAEAEDELVRRRGPERAVLAPDEATTQRGLARALALGGWAGEREGALERLGLAAEAPAIEALFAALPDPNRLPGPLAASAVLGELGSRTVFSANSLEGWVTCPYKWFVEHELTPQRLEPEADPLWLGSLVHDALERLYRDPPGDDSIPRRGDVGRWRARFADLLEEGAVERAGAALNHSRRAALERARIQVEAFLDAEAASETEFRPDPALLEVSFGPFDEDEDENGEQREALALGDVELRGRIDRIDLDPGGLRAIVRDYKTGKSVARAGDFTDTGTLQIQLYMLVAERVLGLEPVAGLYQPLGAVGDEKRRPRGLVSREDERVKALGTVNTDCRDADEFAAALDEAETTAIEAAREMRAGRIGRRPLGGKCPKYCNFQAICRLERAVGAVEENGNGGEER